MDQKHWDVIKKETKSKKNIKLDDFDPFRANRFIVELPEVLNFPSYLVHKTSPILYNKDKGWNPIVLELLSTKENSAIEILNKLLRKSYTIDITKNFRFNYKILDSNGEILNNIKIIGECVGYDFGTLSHDNEDFLICKLKINVNSLSVN